MNTLAWLGIGAPSSAFISFHAFDVLQVDILGFVGAILFLLSLTMAVRGAYIDIQSLRSDD